MSWGLVAVAGATLVGGVVSSQASSKAAGQQSAAARYAGDLQAQAQAENTELQREVFEQGVEERAPFVEAGTEAIGELKDRVFAGPGEFEESPGFDFRVSEGVRALDQSASSKGKLLSGQQSKAVTEFGQNIASQEYDKFLSQYYQSLTPFQSLAGVGQTAIGANTQAGQSFAGNVGNINQTAASNIGASFQNAADVNAQNTINQANISGGALNQFAKIYGQYKGAQAPAPAQAIPQQTSQYRFA